MICVTGATGHVGRELAALFAEKGQRVRAITRRPEEADLPSNVEVLRADYEDPSSLDSALHGVSRLFLMSAQSPGLTVHPTHVLAAVDAARAAGVGRIVLLSVLHGGGKRQDAVTRWIGEAEAAVKSAVPAWTILRPGRFMSNALQWAASIRLDGSASAPFGSRAAASIDPADIAAVTFEALTTDTHGGQTYELSGPESITPREEVLTIARVLGRHLHFVDLPAEAMRVGLHRHGFPAAIVEAMIERTALDDDGAEVLDTVERVTRRPPGRFESWVRRHLDVSVTNSFLSPTPLNLPPHHWRPEGSC